MLQIIRYENCSTFDIYASLELIKNVQFGETKFAEQKEKCACKVPEYEPELQEDGNLYIQYLEF